MLVLIACASLLRGQDLTPAQLRESFPAKIRPIVMRYCQECHSAKRMEAELDLTTFATLADLQKHPQTWQRVGEMLDSLQMPPPDATQPTEADRRVLQQWVRSFLTTEAAARAGDPGKVVLRRLSNAEYTYTLRDLLGVNDLSPAKEFPVDGAAGEGFTNTGNALVMSPALVTKYLDAAKEMAAHAVLQPEGIRFSRYTTRSDWTNETLADIRNFYSQFTDPTGGEQVNLQGVVFNTNGGGRLPVEKYLAATIVEREAIRSGKKTIAAVAAERSLNAKYLGLLWQQLTDEKPSLLFSGLRQRWAAATKAEDSAALTAEIAAWQRGLWRFGSVGHIGKVGGPKRWLEPLSPLTSKQDLKFKLPPPSAGEDIVLSLVTSDLGDGNENDFVVWQQPRLVAPGRPDLLLKDVRAVTQQLAERRARVLSSTTKYLAACAEAQAAQGTFDAAALAKKHEVDQQPLEAWLNYLGLGSGATTKIEGHFTTKLDEAGAYKFVQGWGSNQTPLLLANSSDQHVRIPGNMRAHGVVVHPSPTLRVAVGWQSPVTGKLSMSGTVTHAHTECGNGVTWSLELRRGATRRQFAAGIAQGAKEVKFGPFEDVAVQTGDVIALSIGARDNNHSCDLTNIDWQLSSPGEKERVWNLAKDISSNVLTGNPHDDSFGNKNVWHFFTEADKPQPTTPAIPAGSVLAKWQTASNADEKVKLAGAVQTLLLSAGSEGSDAALHQQLTSLSGPLLGSVLSDVRPAPPVPGSESVKNEYGLDPSLFGKHPNGTAIDGNSLCVRAPSVLEIRLPAALVAGCELITATLLEPTTGKEGSAQNEIVVGKRTLGAALQPAEAKTVMGGGAWTGDNRQTSVSAPILVNDGSAAKTRIETDLNAFRDLFPAALCYTKIVPVDEVVTLMLFYREDDHLVRLMLDDAQRKKLDDLWAELHFVSQDSLTLVDALEQLIQYATQDANPKVFEPLREPFAKRAADYRQSLIDAESAHLSKLQAFAAKAYRRPLVPAEQQELRQLYGKLRSQEIPHEEAVRLTLARVLVSPSFLYKIEKPVPGNKQGPITDLELASRLSYFLWSSQPDEELLAVASAGKLRDPQQLIAQSQRMLKSDKTRRLATEFACQWLHIYDFDQHDEKSERHFPQFAALKDDMYEESIRYFTDLFQNNGSVLDIISSDHTFVNADLAKLYGIPNVVGPNWQRIAEAKKYDRGGILAQAATLSKQSGASRTSPILRGNWISEVLLGERLPRPPKDVPQLPDELPSAELTVRQLVEKHTTDAKCSVCHKRIDPLGFSLEGFDAIGARSAKPGDTSVQTIDGVKFNGLAGLQDYIANTRREAFVRQFCRKLLGYALGRSVQLSDEPLLAEMQTKLKTNNYQMQLALETIILSRQFREIRGQDQVVEE
ncbi:DUF1592 domain-containing protein [Anatilimnocola floriformis]|uniref:DUF1592 domain-containing protein n=1 Tax=Anatilimnocola floriformis TaxID=2948575 RepID=UPI0020C37DBC|nr:DUF1592 domain-containing protein [Anatilimnocola floriformis]